MNSHKMNMYAGTIIGSLLLFLLLGFFSDLIFVGRGHPEHEVQAFAVEIEEAEGGDEQAGIDWAALVAAADPAEGEKLFKKCKACHKVEDGVNGVGPHLWGVVDRDIASVAGYAYSDTLTGMDGSWNLDTLQAFLEAPKTYAPGTKMSFGGLKKAEDRVSLIVYLNEADGSPVELAAAAGAESAETEVAAAAETMTEPTTETTTEPTTETTTEPTTESTAETATETETVAAATEGEPETTTAASGGGDFAELLAAADAEAGKKVFRKCKACHKLEEGKNAVGPSLFGIVGRDIGSGARFNYSDAMKGVEGDWTLANLDAFLAKPKAFAPGNKMSFPGLKKAQDRIDVITFLNEADGSPEPLQ